MKRKYFPYKQKAVRYKYKHQIPGEIRFDRDGKPGGWYIAERQNS